MGRGGEKFFALRVHICLHVTSSIYAPTPLHFYFPPKRKSAFRAFFSQARLVAFLLFLIALIAKLSFKKIATVVFTPGCFHGYRPLGNRLEFFLLYFRQNICLCRVDSLRSAGQQLN